ncbi:NDR1/HIN1-like protein 6 [Musa acuminata AAA Group]|uniref:NDR1/HIN1-like protein 6 n=1 Tax=Musa acuminata AAA Group TaxID=214697 RepID=UPI0031D2BE67
MAEQLRFHAVDMQISPSSFTVSEKSGASVSPSTPGGTARLRPPKRRSRCSSCLCRTLLAVIILIVLIAAAAGVVYVVFRLRLPKYSVDHLRVSRFSVNDDDITVGAVFDVAVTATNPNRKIGIYYEEGSELSLWYADERLCTGSFPVFYQGHRNTTVLHVFLTGGTQVGSELLAELQQQQLAGVLPLTFRGDVPVRVKLDKLTLWKVTFNVRCSVVVDSLTTTDDISVRSSSCRFRLKLW